MDEHDQYESLGIDDSLEDERDIDRIMEDRRAAEIELDGRDARVSNRKLPQLLHDQGIVFLFIKARYLFLGEKSFIFFTSPISPLFIFFPAFYAILLFAMSIDSVTYQNISYV